MQMAMGITTWELKMKHALETINNWLNIEKVSEHYPGAKMIGEFPIKEGAAQSGVLFWQPNPPPEYSHYFMLYYCPLRECMFITSGEKQAKKIYNGIRTPSGDFIWSRHRHDYVVHDGCMVDGGDAYFKTNGKGEHIRFTTSEEGEEHGLRAISKDDETS